MKKFGITLVLIALGIAGYTNYVDMDTVQDTQNPVPTANDLEAYAQFNILNNNQDYTQLYPINGGVAVSYSLIPDEISGILSDITNASTTSISYRDGKKGFHIRYRTVNNIVDEHQLIAQRLVHQTGQVANTFLKEEVAYVKQENQLFTIFIELKKEGEGTEVNIYTRQ